MAGRRKVRLLQCLVLACVLLCALSFVNDLLWPFDDNYRSLAKDALRAANDSVHEVMRPLLEAYEDELRFTSDRKTIGHSSTKFEQLQASLDHFHRGPSHRNIAFEEPSDLRSVTGRRVADTQPNDVCQSLEGRRITMIGGEHIYRLHVLLLQHRELAEGKMFSCQYHEFCTHHHICLPYGHLRDDTSPPRYIKPPTTQELTETSSAVVNYVVSDTLFSARNESSWEYNLPFVDPTTGVRLRETYWLPAARKANVVILGRGPLSAPGQTYAGNWSFLRHVPDYVDKSRAIASGEYKSHDDMHIDHMAPRSLEILNMAAHLTITRFLPDVFQLLRSIRWEVRPSRQKRLIWPSNWYRLPGRGIARTQLLRPPVSKVKDMIRFHHIRPRSSVEDVLALQLSALINADVTKTAPLEDPWTLLFNAQVYLQNMVLRELLPRHDVVFLPLDAPWVMDNWARRHVHKYSYGSIIDVDRERMAAIGEAFWTGLDYVLRSLE